MSFYHMVGNRERQSKVKETSPESAILRSLNSIKNEVIAIKLKLNMFSAVVFSVLHE